MSPAAWLLLLWAAGAASCVARLFSECRQALRLVRRGREVTDGRLVECWHALCRRAGVRRRPRLLAAEGVGSAMLLDPVKPAVILPAQLAEEWDPDAVRMVLAHELAHLRRGDLLWSWLPASLHTLLYFHPGMWLGGREWRLEQEMACDALALVVTRSPASRYGAMLVRLAGAGSASRPALPALYAHESMKALERRLIAMKQAPPAPVRRSPARRALVGSLALLGAIALLVPYRVTAQVRTAQTPAAPAGAGLARSRAATGGAPAVSLAELERRRAVVHDQLRDVTVRADGIRQELSRSRVILVRGGNEDEGGRDESRLRSEVRGLMERRRALEQEVRALDAEIARLSARSHRVLTSGADAAPRTRHLNTELRERILREYGEDHPGAISDRPSVEIRDGRRRITSSDEVVRIGPIDSHRSDAERDVRAKAALDRADEDVRSSREEIETGRKALLDQREHLRDERAEDRAQRDALKRSLPDLVDPEAIRRQVDPDKIRREIDSEKIRREVMEQVRQHVDPEKLRAEIQRQIEQQTDVLKSEDARRAFEKAFPPEQRERMLEQAKRAREQALRQLDALRRAPQFQEKLRDLKQQAERQAREQYRDTLKLREDALQRLRDPNGGPPGDLRKLDAEAREQERRKIREEIRRLRQRLRELGDDDRQGRSPAKSPDPNEGADRRPQTAAKDQPGHQTAQPQSGARESGDSAPR